MQQATVPSSIVPERYTGFDAGSHEAGASGVSWPAVFAGGIVTAALSLILLALGTGLGFSLVSLQSGVGASGAALGTAAILWLIFAEMISSSMGGYLAGRLRTKWSTIHTDEVYFRDTAHGFLAWSLALVTTAAFLGAASTAFVGSSDHGDTSALSQGGQKESGSTGYFADAFLRSTATKPVESAAAVRSEIQGVLVMSLAHGGMSMDDKTYLTQLVAQNTGLSQSDAAKRVTDTFGQAMQAAEATRKSIAHTLLWAFLALLIGAFCASFSATLGGKQRDNVAVR